MSLNVIVLHSASPCKMSWNTAEIFDKIARWVLKPLSPLVTTMSKGMTGSKMNVRKFNGSNRMRFQYELESVTSSVEAWWLRLYIVVDSI
eukprot:UN24019